MNEFLSLLRGIDAGRSADALLIAADWFEDHPEVLDGLAMTPTGRPAKEGVPGWFSRAWSKAKRVAQGRPRRGSRGYIGGASHDLRHDFPAAHMDHHGGTLLTLPGCAPLPVYVSQPYFHEADDSEGVARFRVLAANVHEIARRAGGVGCYIRDSIYQRRALADWAEKHGPLPAHMLDRRTVPTLLWLPHPDHIEKGFDHYDRRFITS